MHPLAVEQRAYLEPTRFIDADHPDVIAFAERAGRSRRDAIGQATSLYYAVRDGMRYEAHHIDLRPDAMRASAVLARGRGFCVAKAVLLAAAARASGIPSRLGFADVRNHLATESMRRAMRTNLFVFHGYTELWLDGRWVKATPAFNRTLCQRFGVAPLEFNGRNDCLFQQADREGKRFLEYVHDRGVFADLPLEQLCTAFEAHYPALVSGGLYGIDGGEEPES
jgi:transglutaminase-like putative cysteine protease